MPEHATSSSPKRVVPRQPSHPTDAVPEHYDVARPPVRPWWSPPWLVERKPVESCGNNSSDLVEGGIAVAALLGMVALGVTPWLAVPLSAVTYIAVTLLRPPRDHQDETINGMAQEQLRIEEAENDGARRLQEVEPDGTDVVAARFGLTRREREILPLLAQRLTDREIAEQLSISHRTAMNHTANILGKIGLTSRRDVAAFVGRHALSPASESPHTPE